MGEEKLIVFVDGKETEVDAGATLKYIAEKTEQAEDVVLALVNNNLRELSKKVKSGDKISFIDVRHSDGRKTYTRGLILMLVAAVNELKGKGAGVRIEHTLGDGIYGEIDGLDCPIDEALTQAIEKKMKQYVADDTPIIKRTLKTSEAVSLFASEGYIQKERLFKFRRTSNTNIYEFAGVKDYYYGFMPYSAGVLKYFKVFPYEDGFILQLPDAADMKTVTEYKPRTNLYKVQSESNNWGRMMDIETVGALNEQLCNGNFNDIVLIQEAFMEKKIGEIAQMIKERNGIKFVMIAGPSSSGKTTFSHRLSIQLKTLGFKPHPIGVDDYFVEREKTPKDENGNYNFECLEAIDVEGFNDDMCALLRGEKVDMPSFNFKSGKREYKGNYLQLGPEDILVIEGIHGLNEKLSYRLPSENKFRIYISALTQINIDEHNRIPTTDARLLRRIVRDARTRGASCQKSISMWPSVRKGEEENIFPFQEGADVMFNSSLIYELTVLKQYAEPLLFSVPKDAPEYLEAKRLLKFLDYFLGASSEDVPKNSIVREFIGGSCFNV